MVRLGKARRGEMEAERMSWSETVKVSWRPGSPFGKLDPERVKTELDALHAEADGPLEPEAIPEWARANPDSELYRAFEWNNRKAAHSYRVSQARLLQRSLLVRVVHAATGTETSQPAFVNVVEVDDDERRQGYRPAAVLTPAEHRAARLRGEARFLELFLERTADLEPELGGVRAAAGAFLAELAVDAEEA